MIIVGTEDTLKIKYDNLKQKYRIIQEKCAELNVENQILKTKNIKLKMFKQKCIELNAENQILKAKNIKLKTDYKENKIKLNEQNFNVNELKQYIDEKIEILHNTSSKLDESVCCKCINTVKKQVKRDICDSDNEEKTLDKYITKLIQSSDEIYTHVPITSLYTDNFTLTFCLKLNSLNMGRLFDFGGHFEIMIGEHYGKFGYFCIGHLINSSPFEIGKMYNIKLTNINNICELQINGNIDMNRYRPTEKHCADAIVYNCGSNIKQICYVNIGNYNYKDPRCDIPSYEIYNVKIYK